jgi:soluble P-type ATPase
MLELEIPGFGRLALEHVVLDVNGTLALDGELLLGVRGRLLALGEHLQLHLLTADTYGRQDEIDRQLELTAVRTLPGSPAAEQKERYVQALGPERVVAVGNGANDALMFRSVSLAIAVLGPEGLARNAFREADILAPDIRAALDLLLHPRRLVATLRC